MLEYATVAGGMLGYQIKLFFNLDSAGELGLLVIAGVTLLGIGGVLKGFWGAALALSLGILLFLGAKGLLPI